MLKTDAYFVIVLVLMLVQQLLSHCERSRGTPWQKLSLIWGFFDFAQDDFAASSTARLIAAIMLSGRAIPFPAISNAVPWSGLVRGNGSPSVTFTPLWNAWSFNGINP